MTAIVEPGGCSHHVYMINGVRVEFPAKAYPSQIAMMEKVNNFHSLIICLFYLCIMVINYPYS